MPKRKKQPDLVVVNDELRAVFPDRAILPPMRIPLRNKVARDKLRMLALARLQDKTRKHVPTISVHAADLIWLLHCAETAEVNRLFWDALT